MIDTSIIASYIDSGLRVIPLSAKKIPPKDFQWRQRIMRAEDFAEFPNNPFLGVVCGKESGNLEVIDIDTKHDSSGKLFEDFMELINNSDPTLLQKLVIQSTMSGGYHFIYRCQTVGRNLKLARNQKKEVVIETRADGGYIVAAPSKGYNLLSGEFTNIGTITEDERNFLFTCARQLDEQDSDIEVPKEVTQARIEYTGGKSPFDEYNLRGDVHLLLESHGFKYVFTSGRNDFYRRHGSDNKYGATFHRDKRVFYVFTSSTQFQQDKGYSPVQAYCTLVHMGNWSACAKDLLDKGYGERGRKQLMSDPFANAIGKKVDTESFLRPLESDRAEIQSWKAGNIVMGERFGYIELDKIFRYKQGNFVCINGFPNIGKTTAILWLLFLLAKMYDKKCLLYTAENETADMKMDLMEFYSGYRLDYMTDDQFAEAEKWVDTHFDFVDIDKVYTALELLDTIEAMEKHYDIVLLDPYAAFILPRTNNSHDYHKEVASRINAWKRRTKTSVWINHHTYTEASRGKGADGQPKAPRAQDTENGQLWWARCDDFLTIHRKPHHPDLWMWTEIHTRKIKRNKTGGRVSLLGEPFMMKLMPGGIEFQSARAERPHVNGIVEEQSQLFEPPKNFYEVERDDDDTPF